MPKSFADYLAIAVGPVLIMLLVGSLNFFLVEVGYRGGFSGQVYWTLFWFTVAAVLVSRISIEQGSAYGMIYGVALGAATGLRLCQFLGAPASALLLLGLIWWCASKLTWDCTVIDDHADASGRGLLAYAGFESGAAEATPESAPAADAEGGHEFEPNPRSRPHAPGLWLIYFSLGALPIFGVGQWTIPLAETAARMRGFILCAVFVTAALGLLLTTSFLGLRRYLRQRRLQMPASMARSWILQGTALVLLVILGALVLPRPRGADTLAKFSLGLRDRRPTASRHAWMPGEAAPGEGRAIGRGRERRPGTGGDRPGAGPGGSSGDEGTGGGAKGRGGRAQGQSTAMDATDSDATGRGDGRGPEGRDGSGRQTGAGGESGEGGESGRTPSEAPGSPELPELPPVPAPALRWFSYLLAATLVVFLVARYGRDAWAALKQLRPPKRPKRRSPGSAEPRRTSAFAAYPDPFSTGLAERLTPAQLTVYTFTALEAWAADAGQERAPEQTPIEFGRSLARRTPESAAEVLGTIRLYVGVAYGGTSPAPESLAVLQRLWATLVR